MKCFFFIFNHFLFFCTRAIGKKMKYFFYFLFTFIFIIFCTRAIGEKMTYFFYFLFISIFCTRAIGERMQYGLYQDDFISRYHLWQAPLVTLLFVIFWISFSAFFAFSLKIVQCPAATICAQDIMSLLLAKTHKGLFYF